MEEIPELSAEHKQRANDELERHHSEWVRHAGQMAGFLYLAGDIAFMAHARRANNGKPDELKIARGLTYIVGSMILLCCTGGSDRVSEYQRSTHDKIKRKLDQDMQDAGIPTKTSDGMMQWIKQELKEHSWEMAYMLFVMGSAMQGVSAFRNKRHIEAAATLGTIASIMLTVAVPEGDQKPFIHFSDNMEKQGCHFSDSYKQIKKSLPILTPAFNIADAAGHEIRRHPLKVSALVGMVANGMYGVQALKKNPAEKWLAAMSGIYLSANVVTGFGSKEMSDRQDKDWDEHARQLHQHMQYNSIPSGHIRSL